MKSLETGLSTNMGEALLEAEAKKLQKYLDEQVEARGELTAEWDNTKKEIKKMEDEKAGGKVIDDTELAKLKKQSTGYRKIFKSMAGELAETEDKIKAIKPTVQGKKATSDLPKPPEVPKVVKSSVTPKPVEAKPVATNNKPEKKEVPRDKTMSMSEVRSKFAQDAIEANAPKEGDEITTLKEKRTALRGYLKEMQSERDLIEKNFPQVEDREKAKNQGVFEYLNKGRGAIIKYLKEIEVAGLEAKKVETQKEVESLGLPALADVEKQFSEERGLANQPKKGDTLEQLQEKLEAVKADWGLVQPMITKFPKTHLSGSHFKTLEWLKYTRANIQQVKNELESAIKHIKTPKAEKKPAEKPKASPKPSNTPPVENIPTDPKEVIRQGIEEISHDLDKLALDITLKPQEVTSARLSSIAGELSRVSTGLENAGPINDAEVRSHLSKMLFPSLKVLRGVDLPNNDELKESVRQIKSAVINIEDILTKNGLGEITKRKKVVEGEERYKDPDEIVKVKSKKVATKPTTTPPTPTPTPVVPPAVATLPTPEPVPVKKAAFGTESELAAAIVDRKVPKGATLTRLNKYIALHPVEDLKDIPDKFITEAHQEIDNLLSVLEGGAITSAEVEKYLERNIIGPCSELNQYFIDLDKKSKLPDSLKDLKIRNFELLDVCENNGIKPKEKAETKTEPEVIPTVPPVPPAPEVVPATPTPVDVAPVPVRKEDLIDTSFTISNEAKADMGFQSWLTNNGRMFERKESKDTAEYMRKSIDQWRTIYIEEKEILSDLKKHIDAGHLDIEMTPSGMEASQAARLRTKKYEYFQYQMFKNPSLKDKIKVLIEKIELTKTLEKEKTEKEAQLQKRLELQQIVESGTRISSEDVAVILSEKNPNSEKQQMSLLHERLTNIANNYKYYSKDGTLTRQRDGLRKMFDRYAMHGPENTSKMGLGGKMWNRIMAFGKSIVDKFKDPKDSGSYNVFAASIHKLEELQLVPRKVPLVIEDLAAENMLNLQTYMQEKIAGAKSSLNAEQEAGARSRYESLSEMINKKTSGWAESQKEAAKIITEEKNRTAKLAEDITQTGNEQRDLKEEVSDSLRGEAGGFQKEVYQELFDIDLKKTEGELRAMKPMTNPAGGAAVRDQLEKILVRWDVLQGMVDEHTPDNTLLQIKKVEILMSEKVHMCIKSGEFFKKEEAIDLARSAYEFVASSDKLSADQKKAYFTEAVSALERIDRTSMSMIQGAELSQFISDLKSMKP